MVRFDKKKVNVTVFTKEHLTNDYITLQKRFRQFVVLQNPVCNFRCVPLCLAGLTTSGDHVQDKLAFSLSLLLLRGSQSRKEKHRGVHYLKTRVSLSDRIKDLACFNVIEGLSTNGM